MGFAFVAKLGKDLEHLAFQGVVRTDNADVSREVSGGGSVSEVPLIPFRITN